MPGARSKRYACTICPYSFDKIALVKKHWINVHKMINLQACKICEIPFASKELAEKHNHAAHDVFCYLCGRGHKNVNQLDDHIIAVHNTALKYTCRICGLNLDRHKWLIDHMKEHKAWEQWLGPLIFTCQVCSTQFLEEGELRDHEKTHSKEWNCWNNNVSKERPVRRLKAQKKKDKKKKS